MAASQDTEITLGTGRMLGLFFALVILCAVVFAMGFSVGKNSVKIQTGDSSGMPTVVQAGKKTSPTNSPSEPPRQTPDMTFYKSVGQNGGDSELSPAASRTTSPDTKSNAADTTAAAPTNGYFVQVAAVSKQDDAEALVEALKKKQYNAVAAQTTSDKLFHVQVGPFADIKDAESMRTQLLSDGYNPILKK
ncbi:MAG: SPOR domain-containing protein [Terriglobales bacterium]